MSQDKKKFGFPIVLNKGGGFGRVQVEEWDNKTHSFIWSLNNNKKKPKGVAATAQIKSKLSVKPLIIILPCG